MPFALFHAHTAKCDAMVEGDSIPDFSRFTDDNTHAVINEQPFADFGTRMDFNAGEEPHQL
jgi:hypothetical protein